MSTMAQGRTATYQTGHESIGKFVMSLIAGIGYRILLLASNFVGEMETVQCKPFEVGIRTPLVVPVRADCFRCHQPVRFAALAHPQLRNDIYPHALRLLYCMHASAACPSYCALALQSP
jgi:hypothetical protein